MKYPRKTALSQRFHASPCPIISGSRSSSSIRPFCLKYRWDALHLVGERVVVYPGTWAVAIVSTGPKSKCWLQQRLHAVNPSGNHNALVASAVQCGSLVQEADPVSGQGTAPTLMLEKAEIVLAVIPPTSSRSRLSMSPFMLRVPCRARSTSLAGSWPGIGTSTDIRVPLRIPQPWNYCTTHTGFTRASSRDACTASYAPDRLVRLRPVYAYLGRFLFA